MKPEKPSRLILASSSPRRRELMRELGVAFEIAFPTLEEPDELGHGLSPREYAESLAYFKARSVAEAHAGDWILGADTIAAVGGEILGKPTDADHARTMLHTLSHHPHEVITGLALLGPDGQRVLTSETTRITMKPMTPEDIESYLATGEWEGKAGAYAIQESADRYILKVDGSFSNVVGLPLERVETLLRENLFPKKTGTFS